MEAVGVTQPGSHVARFCELCQAAITLQGEKGFLARCELIDLYLWLETPQHPVLVVSVKLVSIVSVLSFVSLVSF